MITPFDDYPIHQGPQLIAHVAGGHPDAFESYEYFGYDREGTMLFAQSLYLHPNRKIVDASISVFTDGHQRSLSASGRLSEDPHKLTVGPLHIEIIEPLKRYHLVVEAAELGFSVNLEFLARTEVVEEDPVILSDGSTLLANSTQLIQWGSWNGVLTVDGITTPISFDHHLGIRNRSWGIHPIDLSGHSPPAHSLPQIFELSAALDFGESALSCSIAETATGKRLHESIVAIPMTPDLDARRGLECEVTWQPGTRWSQNAVIEIRVSKDLIHRIEMETLCTFLMRGLGFTDPDWIPGLWKGDAVVGTRSWLLSEINPTDYRNIYAQQVVKATWTSPDGTLISGNGLLKQLAVNSHMPSGLVGFLSGSGS